MSAGDAVNCDAALNFLSGEAGAWIVVNLLTGDDVDAAPSLRQTEGELGKNLAGRRMIREEVSIEEENALH